MQFYTMNRLDEKMSNEKAVKTVIVRLNAEEAEIFNAVAKYFGLRNDSEVFRHLMTRFYNENRDKLSMPRFEHFNLDEHGVKILDRTNPQRKFYVQIHFKPKGILCEHCQTNKCPHIDFALEQPDIQQVIRKKRLEGWKLPDV